MQTHHNCVNSKLSSKTSSTQFVSKARKTLTERDVANKFSQVAHLAFVDEDTLIK